MKLLVLLLIALTPIFLVSSSSGQDIIGPVRIFSVTQGTASLNLGSERRSAGDRSFQGLLLVDREDHIIGYGSVVCTFLGRTLPGSVSQCQGHYILPRGKIVTLGTRQRNDYYIMSIIGGTGFYSTMRGVLIVSTIQMGPRRERLFFSPE